MADYDRNFYSRKGHNNLKWFLLIAMVVLVCYGINLYTTQFYDMTFWDALNILFSK